MQETIYGSRKVVVSLLLASILYATTVLVYAAAIGGVSQQSFGHLLAGRYRELGLAAVVFLFQLIALTGGQGLVTKLEETKHRVLFFVLQAPFIGLLLYLLLPYPWCVIAFFAVLVCLSGHEYLLARGKP